MTHPDDIYGGWRPIETAPKDGTRVKLLIPYDRDTFTEGECTDEGYWDSDDGCWRFDGDDGPDDIQPTDWMPLSPPSPSPSQHPGALRNGQ